MLGLEGQDRSQRGAEWEGVYRMSDELVFSLEDVSPGQAEVGRRVLIGDGEVKLKSRKSMGQKHH